MAGVLGLAVGSIGVVYGDIGTSPLYAFREAVNAAAGPDAMPTPGAVYGVLSLILWALIFIVTFKYVIVLLRADNNGEGGTLTLMALARKAIGESTVFVVMLGIIGAALFFGDALITPAISVLSAIEGLKDVAWIGSQIEPYIVPLTVAILVALFAFQSRGTAGIASFFGPLMTIWFVAIAVPGVIWIASNPGILLALNPVYGVAFLFGHGVTGLLTLGAVFLAVTGAEALYADLGHFGRRPIQAAWLVLVFPALALNYLGQGALVLANPAAIKNPFFLLYPEMLRLPMVLLATAATVIASQAVITGAYSLTRQAIALGLLPRLEIRHTSAEQEGADLHAARQHFDPDGCVAAGRVVPLVERPCVRIRHRGHRHHGGNRRHGLHRGAQGMGLVAASHYRVDRALCACRLRPSSWRTCSR